jgi:hypothetical protein
MADSKTLGAIVGGALIVGAGIFWEKPAEDVVQFDDAQIITSNDAKILPAHCDTITKTEITVSGKDTTYKEVIDKIVDVPEIVDRPQVSIHVDSIFRSGDVYSVSIKRNDSLIQENKVIVSAETYPKNAVLKAINYTQWVPSIESN